MRRSVRDTKRERKRERERETGVMLRGKFLSDLLCLHKGVPTKPTQRLYSQARGGKTPSEIPQSLPGHAGGRARAGGGA